MATLTHPNGSTISVPDELVDKYVAFGFKQQQEKKSAPKRTAKSAEGK